jgi:hypothetical protein
MKSPPPSVPPLELAASLACALLVASSLISACSPFTSPTPAPWAGLAAVLNIESRGGPAVVIRIGATEATRISCDASAALTPGLQGMPSLPWELRVSRQSDNQLHLARTINTLPQWLVLLGNNVSLSDSPVLGPAGPPCASP